MALSWPSVTNATRYWIYRNEGSCTAGFTRIAVVSAPTTTYTDTEVANGTTYNYRLMSATASDSCTSGVGACVSAVPVPCTTPGVPAIGTATVPGNNQITISWTAGSPAGATYNVYRSTGACPGGTYTLIQSGLTASPWTDTTVSGGTTYSYEVAAVDSTGGCESAKSGCASALATGACTAPPAFAGLTSVTNPGNSTCTLNLTWSAATANCGGPVTYRIYRSTTTPFTPAAGNRIASAQTGTTYMDNVLLTSGTIYYYIVHAVDGTNAAEDANTVIHGTAPTGPITISGWTDTFEGSNSGGGFDQTGWTHSAVNGSTNWAWSTAQKHDGTHSWFAEDMDSISDMVLVSPSFGVAASPGTTLSFYHTYAFEGDTADCYDGGTLEYSTNGGTTWTVVPAADFTAGAYTGTAYTGYGNPIGGEAAWCGGTVGTMTLVTVNLGADANLVNKTVQLRWHEGSDDSETATGWYVDTVAITNAQVQGTCTTSSGCTTPGVPTIGAVTVPGSNQLTVSWTAGTPAGATYNIYRSTGACPGGTYTLVKSGQASSPWTDTTVGGGTTYSYEVTAVDTTAYCESAKSGCASATATGTCTNGPTFAGLVSVTNPGNTTCALSLAWAAGTSNCSGTLAYSIYRSTTTPFTPAAGNRIASGVTGLTYSDSVSLTDSTTYYYIVHAVDASNGIEETNTVIKSSAPTGPLTISNWTDTFEGANSGGGFDLTGWTHSAITGTTNWAWSTAQKHDGTHSWFAQDIGTASDMVLVSPSFGVGASPNTTLSFWHTYAFEGSTSYCYDGGTLEYTTNGGTTWTVVPSTDFTAGAYTGVIYLSSNPIFNKAAWCGGTIGTMTGVAVNLGGDANLANKTVQLRWHEGNDNVTGATGWYVDSVALSNAKVQAVCTTGSGCSGPGAPAITSVADASPCVATGVKVNFTAGSGAASHNLLKDGVVVVTGYTSGATYVPGDASSHTYIVRAISGGCSADSPAVAGTDAAGGYPAAPTISSVSDKDACAASGVGVAFTNAMSCGAQSAVYNSTYKAPACATTGISCDSGTTAKCAYTGESNQPNTVNAGCADGTSNTGCDTADYSSVDQITIASNDGTCLAPGKAATITAKYYCGDGSSDYLSIWYATTVPGSGSPTWLQISAPTACSATGIVTTTYSLTLSGSAGLQAIRAEIVYASSTANACNTTTNWADRDDLVFSVGAGGTPTVSDNLLKDGATVVTGYTSNAAYIPGDTNSHTYIVQAVDANGCTANSTGSAGTDVNNAPGTPVITGITDLDACAATGIQVAYTAGSGALSHNLLKDGTVVVTGFTSGATYVPGDSNTHTYIIRAVGATCASNSAGMAGTDANGTVGAPAITGITDVDTCAATGIQVAYTAGSGATSHNLLKDGVEVATGYTSNATYVPGDTAGHTYVIRAVSACSTTDSAGVAGTDADNTPGAPAITGITDVSACAANGIQIAYTAGSGAASHNLLKDGTVVVTGYASNATYVPGDTNSHTYTIRAVSGTCTADRPGVAGKDDSGTPGAPAITGITDVSTCATSGIQVAYTAGSGAASHNLLMDGALVVTGYATGAAYTPPDTASHTYIVQAVNGTCTANSAGVAGTDVNNTPGQPVITTITDASACIQSGVQVNYTPGTGATRHALFKDGASVVSNYTSGVLYNPGDSASHTYAIVAVHSSCTKHSTGVVFADGINSYPSMPAITGITDNDACAQDGVKVNFAEGAGCSAQTAAYNATTLTPACTANGISCDSGALLNCSYSGESNTPNTINASCADGTNGTAANCTGANQSVTQITVASADNTCMAVGKTVTITARFWCRNTGDYTLVGYASSVPSSGDVTWTQVGTVTACPAGGAFTRTLTTTLSGLVGLQAVRAEIANNPITSACYSTGNRHDADDLVFMVSAAPTSHNLLVDGSVAVSGYASGTLYNPGDGASHTYVVQSFAGACTTDGAASPFADANASPGAPVLTGITDNNPAVQDGIHVAYTPGSGATRHDLYKDGVSAVTGYVSGALVNPGDTSNHTYTVRAVNAACHADSSGLIFADASSAGTPPAEPDPGNTPSNAQRWTDKNTPVWDAVSGATYYKLYRGGLSNLPNLITTGGDGCLLYNGPSTSYTDSSVLAPGSLYWYLVIAGNGAGESSAGNATAGPRILNSTGTCP